MKPHLKVTYSRRNENASIINEIRKQIFTVCVRNWIFSDFCDQAPHLKRLPSYYNSFVGTHACYP